MTLGGMSKFVQSLVRLESQETSHSTQHENISCHFAIFSSSGQY